MAFWSDVSLEPRRSFKFLLYLGESSDGGERGVPVWVVKSTGAPKINIDEAAHNFLNHEFFFPGLVKYDPITVTLVDAIDVEISDKLIAKLVQSGYNTPDSANEAKSSIITKGKASAGLGTVRIEQLGNDEDGQDKKIAFVLKGAWVKNLNFPDTLDYSTSEVANITMEIRYDYFHYEGVNGVKAPGFGTPTL